MLAKQKYSRLNPPKVPPKVPPKDLPYVLLLLRLHWSSASSTSAHNPSGDPFWLSQSTLQVVLSGTKTKKPKAGYTIRYSVPTSPDL